MRFRGLKRHGYIRRIARRSGKRRFERIMNKSELIIYQTDDGRTRIEAQLEDETV